jgi:tRNA1Val (adenine37-N6)-methyltransferase
MKVTTDACLFGAWVATKIKKVKAGSKSFLDIGTGTGLLSLMIAQEDNQLSVDTIEIDADAYEQAKENISASGWQSRITIFNSDARDFSFTKKYNGIISNPPFYEYELTSEDAKKNTAHHSSELSFEELLKLVKNNLDPSGSFYLLMPFKREKEIKQLFETHELYISEEVLVRQSVKHDFFRIMVAGNMGKTNRPEKSELSIWNEHRVYTHEFIHLLKDYYLYL